MLINDNFMMKRRAFVDLTFHAFNFAFHDCIDSEKTRRASLCVLCEFRKKTDISAACVEGFSYLYAMRIRLPKCSEKTKKVLIAQDLLECQR